MRRGLRRTFVVSGVVASLLAGALSIRLAADLTAAAAPPPAPPISMAALRDALAVEQARGAVLQAQLDDLLSVTDELTAALTSTEGEVTVDGLTAKELRERLTAADAKLDTVNRLLKRAQRRIAALGGSVPTLPPSKPASGSGGSGGGSSSGTAPTSPPTATPTARPATFSLSLELASGNVQATWTTCSAGSFDSYALVRSTDSEIHFPPEDGDTLVARIANRGTTSTVVAAPSGSRWYRLYCLVTNDGETKTAATTSTVRMIVP